MASETFALAGRRVIRFAVTYAVVVAVVAVLGLVGYTAISSGAADPTAVGTQVSVLLGATLAGLLTLACVIGVLVCTVVWVISAHLVAPGGPGPAGYGALALCAGATVLAYVLPDRMTTPAASVATEAALRIGGVAVLVAGVLVVRRRISRLTGERLPAGRPALVTSEDWDASKWDPEVLRDIDRRRGANG